MAWSANTALQTFLKNPTEDFKSALVWAAECGSLLQAAGQVVSHIPGGIGTVLSAAFQIPSKAIAAYSNIMVEYVATIDAVSGGSSNGPKVIIPGEDEPLTGAVSSIAQGASVRKMGDIMSIIWANKEVLQQLSREDAKMFVAHKLGAMIASTGPGDQSYEMLGTKVGRSTSDIPWLIKQRDYVLSIKP